MSNETITLEDANKNLKNGYPNLSEEVIEDLKKAHGQLKFIPLALRDYLKSFPFSEYLEKVWVTDDRYPKHGPAVLEAMNILLSKDPTLIFKSGPADLVQRKNLKDAVDAIRGTIEDSEKRDRAKTDTLLRFAALYHDIGKAITPERHPVIGWYIAQYIKAEEREKLRGLLQSEDDVRLLMTIIRDHDQFGVLSTGEASLPILLGAIHSGKSHDDRKRIISALALCNLADLAGTFDVDGEATDRLLGDWRWFMGALDHCAESGTRVDEYLVQQAKRTRSAAQTKWETKLLKDFPYVGIPNVSERVRRLLMEASRGLRDSGRALARRTDFNDEHLIASCLQTVFGSENVEREFARQFTYVCKLDYGKRFFTALIQYCEGDLETGRKRMSKDDVIYNVFAVLKRITVTYAAMMRSGDDGLGNLIGVELKDLTPYNAPEKTDRIIELIVSSHYPGLTWMMSDAPAWYF
jgi:hypothetical protein